MSPGNQVALVVINSGVVVQYPPPVSIVDAQGQKQPTQNIAKHVASMDELEELLCSLNLFEQCGN